MATSSAKPKILPLTSARFFAALYVMLYHTLPRGAVPNQWQDWVNKFIGMGYQRQLFLHAVGLYPRGGLSEGEPAG